MGKAMGKKEITIQERVRRGEITAEEAGVKETTCLYNTTSSGRKNSDRVSFGNSGRPSYAQTELIKRYKADKKKDIVENTISAVVDDCIIDIKEAVDNMIEYGDNKIYKVLPKELDDKMRAYGMFAQEYFGKENHSLDGMPVFVIPATYKQCNKCSKFKSAESFFVSKGDTSFGKSCICKDCANTLFEKYLFSYGIKEALVIMCQKLDVPAYEPTITKYISRFESPQGKNEIVKKSFFGNFMGDLSIALSSKDVLEEDWCFCKTNLHGVPFRDVHAKFDMPQVYDDVFEDGAEDNLDSLKGIEKSKKKWGNFSKEDLRWLEDKYNEWYDQCEIVGLAREKLVMQLCYEELEIVRAREKNIPVKDKVKSFREIMNTADLTPKKQSTSASTSQFASLGEFIKHAEVNKPIINKNKEFEDVDKIEKMWKSIAGAIHRTLGKDSEYVKDFEENYKEYTVDMTVNQEEKDGDTDAKSTE